MKPFRVLSREKILENPFLPVEKQRVIFPNGSEGDWYIARNNDAIIVVAQENTEKFIVLQTYKHGGGAVINEFCAGMVDDGEEPLQAAKRELREETGFSTDEAYWHFLGSAFSNPTGASMRYHYFLATHCKKTHETALDASEQIEVEKISDWRSVREKSVSYTHLTLPTNREV